MRKFRKKSFRELVMENKHALLKDKQAMDLIEEKLEKRAQERMM